MKVPYVEDLANHSSPKSCGGYGNALAEALTGESVGRLMSSEITFFRVLTPCTEGEGHTSSSAICELLNDPAESKNPACVDALHAGIRRSERNPSFKAGIGESRKKNLLLHRRWLCSGGNDEQENQSANGGWTGEGEMLYVQFIKPLGSRTQHSTEEAGEQEEISTSAESVEGRALTKRNSGIQEDRHSPYTVTDN